MAVLPLLPLLKAIVNNTLIDTWFTVDQLETIKRSLDNYYQECSSDVQLELMPILEHLDHLIKHYNYK